MSYSFVQVNEFTPACEKWTIIGQITNWYYDSNESSFLLQANSGVSVKIYILGPSAFRVRFNPLSSDYSNNDSYAVVNRNLGSTSINYHQTTVNNASVLEIVLDNITLKVGLNPYGIAVYRGSQVIHQDTYQYNLVYIPSQEVNACFKSVIPGASYYGFGEKGGADIDNNFYSMTFFNYDNFEYDGSNVEQGDYSAVIPANNQPGPLNVSEPLYNSMPIMVEWNPNPPTTGYFGGKPYACAILLDNPGQTYFNIQSNDYTNNMLGRYYFGGLYGEMDYYFMAGDNVPAVLQQMLSLIGTAPMPPMYSLGFQQGCYGYYDSNRLKAAADAYRANQIPIDGLHIDVDFQNNYRTFTVSDLKFPNVAQMFEKLHANGFKCSTNITGIITTNPIDEMGNEVIDEALKSGMEQDVFIKNEYAGFPNYPPANQHGTYFIANESYGCNTGFNPYSSPNPPYDPSCTGAGCTPLGTYGCYADMGKDAAKEWWGEQYQYLLDVGLDMIWQDMTCPAVVRSQDSYANYKTLPLNIMMTDLGNVKKPNAKFHNAFAYNLISATYAGLTKIKQNLPDGHYNQNKRNFIIARGGYTGIHRYAASWTGDSASSWDFLRINIPEVLNWGISGQPFCGCDIGGFGSGGNTPGGTVLGPGVVYGGEPSPELLTRWMTMGAFLPWYRNHYDGYTKAFQEPYNYPSKYGSLGETVLSACRKYVEIRYKLLQLFYDKMYEWTQTGMPLCRTMFLNDPTDSNLYNSQNARLADQFFVGNHLLVAPIVYQGATERPVYLPSGYNWYVYTDNIAPLGDPTPGGIAYQWYNVGIDLVPIYVREGAIIPVRQLEQWVGQLPENPLTYSIYPGRDSEYVCYQDDGISMNAQEKEEYRLTSISHKATSNGGQEVTIDRKYDKYTPPANFYYVSFLGRWQPSSVIANGTPLALVQGGSDEQNANALAASTSNAYYYNQSLKTAFVKIFDNASSMTLSVSF